LANLQSTDYTYCNLNSIWHRLLLHILNHRQKEHSIKFEIDFKLTPIIPSQIQKIDNPNNHPPNFINITINSISNFIHRHKHLKISRHHEYFEIFYLIFFLIWERIENMGKSKVGRVKYQARRRMKREKGRRKGGDNCQWRKREKLRVCDRLECEMIHFKCFNLNHSFKFNGYYLFSYNFIILLWYILYI
jgi:hypothetical protein